MGTQKLSHPKFLGARFVVPNHGEGSLVALKCKVAIYSGMPKKTLDTTLLTLENMKNPYLLMYLSFFVFMLVFTILFTFSEFLKALILVKNLPSTGF